MVVKENVAAVVERISAPVAEELGLELVDVEFAKEGGSWILRGYIDKPGGIDHGDCELVSHRLDTLLDEKDPIPREYYLEVSSPGIERPLKKLRDFQRFHGHLVNVTTYAPLGGRKKFTGKLEGVEAGMIFLEEKGEIISIPMVQVSSARLHVEF